MMSQRGFKEKPYKKKKIPKTRQVVRYQPPTSTFKKAGGLYFPRTKTIRAPLPQTFRSTLEYSDYYTFNPDATSPGLQAFRLNSLHDPDLTGIGHQPRGFDQIAEFYTRYCVVGARVTMHLLNNFSTEPLTMALIVTATNPPTPFFYPTFTRDVLEYPTGNVVYRIQNSGQGNNLMVMKKTVNMAQVMGISDIMSESDTHALFTTNPSKVVYGGFHIGSSTNQDVGSLTVVIKISFDAIFTELKQLGPS